MGVEGIDTKGGIPTNVRENEDGNIIADIVRTTPWNYPSAIGDLFPAQPSGAGLDFQRTLIGPANPLFRAGAAALTGQDIETGFPIRDKDGQAVNDHERSFGDVVRAFGDQGLYTLPVASLLKPREKPPSTNLRQPARTFNQRLFGYLTGLNVVTKDLTLQQRQALAYLTVPKDAPPELEALIKDLKRKARADIKDPAQAAPSGPPVLAKPKKPSKPRKPRKPTRGS